MPKAPDVIMREVIQNEYVFNIWKHIVEEEDADVCDDPYYKIVKAQYTEYGKHNKKHKGHLLDPKEEGYQIGSPWHGDLENGKIMFLSSNPAITPGCYYPRYHGNGRYTWYGDRVITGNLYLNNPKQDRYPVNNPDTPCNLNAAIDFLRDRFKNTPLKKVDPNAPLWSVYMLNSINQVSVKGRSVDFWNNLWKTVVNLSQITKDELQTPQAIRDVLNNVVSAEIVPFVSMGEDGVQEILEDCWDKYAQYVLALCPARVVFLVGGKVRNLFNNLVDNGKITLVNSDQNVHQVYNDRQIVEVKFGDVTKKIGFLRHFSNGWSQDDHLPAIWFKGASANVRGLTVFEEIQQYIK